MAPRSVTGFLDEFVLPLVHGGKLRVGAPIDSEELQRFTDELPHASVSSVAIDDARTDIVAGLVVRPPALIFGDDELWLAAALHNALFFIHPDADDWGMTARLLRRVADSSAQFAARPRTSDRIRSLARHSLIHNMLDLTRRDLTVSWWTGKATFWGQKPPERLTRWRTMRRVRTEPTITDSRELLAHPQVASIVEMLLRRSPLTQLLDGRSPVLHWEDAVFVLRDAELARAVAVSAVDPAGFPEDNSPVAAPARFAAAFEQMLERSPGEPEVRAVAAFLVHLNALIAFAETNRDDGQRGSPLLAAVLATERAGERPRGLTTFFALPNAMTRVDPRISEPPGLREDTRLFARWRSHRRQVEQCVGDAVISTLADRLSGHLATVPPVELAEGSG